MTDPQPKPAGRAAQSAPDESEPVDLTGALPWEYRVVHDGRAGPWFADLDELAATVLPPLVHADWPTAWTVFGPVEYRSPWRPVSDPASGDLPPEDVLRRPPDRLTLAGRTLAAHTQATDARGLVDLVPLFGEPYDGRAAYLFAAVDLAEDADLLVHAGADWWMQWWVDGRPVFDTLASGNSSAVLDVAYEFPLTLAAGRHVLAVRVISGKGGWAFATEATCRSARPARVFHVEARRVFTCDNPRRFVSLTQEGNPDHRALLNGRPAALPVEGMKYCRVPGIPAGLLKAGSNELSLSWSPEESAGGLRVIGLRHFRSSGAYARLDAPDRLFGLPPAAARIQTGPFLQAPATDGFLVSCRTNMPVAVQVRAAGKTFRSPPGLLHHVSVTGLAPGAEYPYTAEPVGVPAGAMTGTARTLPAQGEVAFAYLSDTGSRPDMWARTASAVAARRPAFAVFGGDAVSFADEDHLWDKEWFGPGRDFFANVPLLFVAGNHDRPGPLPDLLFRRSGEASNWTMRAGGALLVGLDGSRDWAEGGTDAHWLESLLAASRGTFIFLFTHYPGWTSAGHGTINENGQLQELPMIHTRQVILPLAARYGVTALFAGHDHCYERSELPGGVTAITSGGAGAYLYRRSDGPDQNPYSKVFVSAHHYCLIRVRPQECRLESVDLDGRILDTRFWPRRP